MLSNGLVEVLEDILTGKLVARALWKVKPGALRDDDDRLIEPVQ